MHLLKKKKIRARDQRHGLVQSPFYCCFYSPEVPVFGSLISHNSFATRCFCNNLLNVLRLFADFCVWTPRISLSHKIVNIHFGNIKSLLIVRWRNHSRSKGLANNTTHKKTKPSCFRTCSRHRPGRTKAPAPADKGREELPRRRAGLAHALCWRDQVAPATRLKQHRPDAVSPTGVWVLACYSLTV